MMIQTLRRMLALAAIGATIVCASPARAQTTQQSVADTSRFRPLDLSSANSMPIRISFLGAVSYILAMPIFAASYNRFRTFSCASPPSPSLLA